MNKGIWIWKYKDFEFYHNMKYCLSREERGKIVPVWFEIPNHSKSVWFFKSFYLPESETVRVESDGTVCFFLDNVRLIGADSYTIPAGEHKITIAVGNTDGMCAIKVTGKYVYTDTTWLVDKWFPTGETVYAATSPLCAELDTKPSDYKLPEIEINRFDDTVKGNERIIDLGKESVVSLEITGLNTEVSTQVKYGESLEETYSDRCVIVDETKNSAELKMQPRACRYIRFIGDTDFNLKIFSSELPMNDISYFKADDRFTAIYDVSKYTLKLCSRMFLLDGVKRDVWSWPGDNFVSSRTHYYSFFDKEIIKRTLIATRGNDHNNMIITDILGFSFYWFLSVNDYYEYTGDLEFVKLNYKSMKLHMEFILKHCDKDGLLENIPGVWNFIDWHDLETDGANCIIQMLFGKAIKILSDFATLFNEKEDAVFYLNKYIDLKNKINTLYWDDENKGYVTSYVNGKPSKQIRRHQNYFAILFEYADDNRKKEIINNIVLNDRLPKITTPFFKFFENEVLCSCGMVKAAFDGMKKYWGDMLDLGATAVWEEFDSDMTGVEHYAMYDEPFDKSLCHAWGSVPVYFIGKYLAGVTPAEIGYAKTTIKPTCDVMDFKARVPVNNGYIDIELYKGSIKVRSTVKNASLYLQDEKYDLTVNELFELKIL